MNPSFSPQLLTVLFLAATASLASAGDVTGKVTFKGTPKTEVAIPLTPACGKLNTSSPTTRHFVVSKDGGLANVFVYIKDAKKAEAKGAGPTLDQTGCMYEPYVFGVVTGQKFKVHNSDSEMHNVHATPKNNPEFNFVQLKGGENERSFDKAEVLARIKCDVHPWMFAYVGVCDHPYFAVTDKDGNFKISGVPDGKYTIEAFHQKSHVAAGTGIVKSIDVKGDTKQDFTVEPAP
jgi:plastocyanin